MTTPTLRSRHRVLSIDPGTNHLGYAIMDVDYANALEPIVLVEVGTLNAVALSRPYTTLLEVHGEKVTKLYALEQAIKRILETFKPDKTVSESPYMGSFPQAYAALVECLKTIRSALIDYDPCMPLHIIDPASIKAAVGVSGKSGNKGLMTDAVADLVSKNAIVTDIDIRVLDEHSVDSIAAGYAYIRPPLLTKKSSKKPPT